MKGFLMVEMSVDYDAELGFWDGLFPGRGEALVRTIWPFYRWDSLPKPALPDLEERVLQSVAQIKFQGLKIKGFRICKAPLKDVVGSDSFEHRLDAKHVMWEQIHPQCMYDLSELVEKALRNRLYEKMGSWLPGCGNAQISGRGWDSYRRSIESCRDPLWWHLRERVLRSHSQRLAENLGSLGSKCGHNFGRLLFLSCSFALVGDTETQSGPKNFCDLYLAGNFLFSTSWGSELLVLVAD